LFFVNVVFFIGRGEYLTLVDHVHTQCFQDLGFHKVTDTHLGHYRDADGIHDLGDLTGVGHSGHSSGGPYICWHLFQGHYGHGPCLFGDGCLFSVNYIHDHSALGHLGKALL
jgi:hypothetical protein